MRKIIVFGIIILLLGWIFINYTEIKRSLTSWDLRESYLQNKELFIEMAEFAETKEFLTLWVTKGKVGTVRGTVLEEYEINLFTKLYYQYGVENVFTGKHGIIFDAGNYRYLIFSHESIDEACDAGTWGVKYREMVDANWFYYEAFKPRH